MIRPLRIRHRHMWMLLGFIIPGVFLVSILGRIPIEPMEQLPVSVSGRLEPSRSPAADKILVEIDPNHLVQVHVEVPLRAALADALVYWSASEDVAQGYLLGTLVPGHRHIFSLDPSRSKGTGYLLVYSLAHQEVVLTHNLKTGEGTP